MSALAELKTPDGTFLIQERRSVPRDPSPEQQEPTLQEERSSAPPMIALGGLIILGVLAGSYTTKYDIAIGHAHGPLAFPAVGFLALQLFLARSAFRLFHDVRQFKTIAAYAQNRILRYSPAVIPAVLLGFVLTVFAGLPCFHANAASLLANLTMTADMVGATEVDSSHWRLKIEILLSVLIALSWFGPMRRHLAAMLLVGLALSTLYLNGEPARQNVLTLHGVMTADGYFPLFAFGIALHQFTQNRSARVWWIIGAASVALVYLSNTPWHGAFVVAALAALSAIVMGRLVFLGRVRVLVLLGELAFPIYVVHYVTGFILIHRLEAAGAHPVIAIAAASLVAILLGKIVNVVFEVPAMVHGPVAVEAALKAARKTMSLGLPSRKGLYAAPSLKAAGEVERRSTPHALAS